MPTRVKICGITRLEDALLAAELGAAAMGFNFYRPSPRFIEPADARAIIAQLPPFRVTVGVFADEAETVQVLSKARLAGVTAVQLHGPRHAAFGEVMRALPLIVAVRVGETFKAEDLGSIAATAFLLDAYDSELPGGTGKTFDWNLARDAKKYGPIILAGGLTAENVGHAIREVQPYAVDVASGVESAPGIKDPAKLRAFFAAVEEADRNL
jgi:phosphoribosylanthranilate isomerase